MNFDQAAEFKKDLKRLQKKWRSLPGDVEAAKADLVALYVAQPGINIQVLRDAFFNGKRATILYSASDGVEVVKMRLDVESIGRNDKARIVFVALKHADKVLFIELYAKNEKDREDQARIKKYTGMR